MSRQTHSKQNVTRIAFLLIIVSIGFPFQSIDVTGIEISLPTAIGITLPDIQSDYLILNLLLGNGEVGRSIFDLNTYQNKDPIAYGQVFTNSTTGEREDPIDSVIIGRMADMETIQIGERKFITSTKPLWIQNNEGEYVERIIQDDVNGVQFESSRYSYYYDKKACALSVYDSGRISVGDSTIIKSDSWVAKSALNGTDTWTDLSQNSLSCVVTVIDDDSATKIISVRGDENGIFTETYVIDKPLAEMKTILSFWNNNTSINNHKIAFSNILNEVPSNFRFVVEDQYSIPAGNYTAGALNGTIGQYYSPITYQMENYTITDYTYPEEIIDTYKIIELTTNNATLPQEYDLETVTYIDIEHNISVDDLWLANATDGTKSGFTMDYWSEKLQRTVPLKYDFINDSIDELWNVKIINDFRGNHVYIDYMNTEELTLVGETATLDPATNLGIVYVGVTTHAQVGTDGNVGCKQQDNNLAFDNNFRWEHHLSGGTFPNQNESNGCVIPVTQIDITAIPDDASVLQMDFGINATAVLCSSSNAGSCTIASQWVSFDWGMGNGEQILSLNGIGLGATVMPFTDGITENFEIEIVSGETVSYPSSTQWALEPDGTGTFGCSPTSCRFETNSYVDPHAYTDLFETYLESGKNYVIWSACHSHASVALTAGCGYGRQAGGNSPAFNVQNDVFYDENTFDLQITWEIFALAGAPQTLTCESTAPTELFLDWEIPLDDGGTPTTGWQIERSTGGGFTIIEANLPPTPTAYTDTTVFAGLSFTYRVSPINDVGAGDFAEISCGVAGLSGEIVDLVATNQALGIVALDWSAPTFTGNTQLVGYKIDRTTGTPQLVPDVWNSNNQRTNAFCVIGLGAAFKYEQGSGSGGSMVFNSIGNSSACNIVLWAVFDKDELDKKQLDIDWSGSTGNTEARVRVYDGALKGGQAGDLNVNFPQYVTGATIDIVPQVDTTGDGIPDAGVGIIQNALSRSSNFARVIDSVVLDTSLATQQEVTLVFMIRDVNVGIGTCCTGLMHVYDFTIEGLGTWSTGVDRENFGLNSPQVCNGGFCPSISIINSNSDNQILFDDDTLSPLPPTGFIFNQDGFFNLINDTGLVLEYLDTTVAEQVQYGYRAFVWNTEGLSESSNIAIVTTAGAPQTPVITATPTGTQTITIDWVTPDLAGGTLVEYEIERKQGLAGIFAGVGSTANTTFDDGSGLFTLLPATEYCYQIKTITNVGESAFGIESCATTFDSPSEVENLVVTALDGSSVDMSFDIPLDDGGSTITGFKIEQKIGAGNFVTLEALTFDQSRNDTGLPIGTLIIYRVSASNQFGFGNTVQASDTTDATPQVPQNFICSSATPDSIGLSWDTPNTFSPPTGYQIDRNINGGAFLTLVADTASTATTFTDSPLLLDTIYGYKILAHTAEGDTLLTNEVFCKVLGNPEFPPENFQASFPLTIPHEMTLTWDIPNTFGIPITSFVVERDDGAGFNVIATLPSNAVGMVDNDLDNDIQQKYRMKLTGVAGETPYNIGIPIITNQTSHWHYEKTIDDTGANKNAGTITGIADFSNAGIRGQGNFFDNSYITVDNESDYDYDQNTSFGITTYFKGDVADSWQFFAHHSGTSPSTPAGINFNNQATYLQFSMATQVLGNMGTAVLWKVFNATEIDGETLDIRWSGLANLLTAQKKEVLIFDGDYSTPAFHIANGANTVSCVSGCKFPEASAMTTFGAGLLQTGISRQDNFGFTNQNFVINTSGATDPSGKVTVFVRNNDNDFDQGIDTNNYYLRVEDIDITNVGFWDFGTDSSTLVQQTAPSLDPANSGFVSLASDSVIVSKANSMTSTGFNFFLTPNGELAIKLTNTESSNQIYVTGTTQLLDNTLHFLGMGYNGNGTASGISLMVDGVFENKTVVVDNLSGSILNNEPLTIGATSSGANTLLGLLDDTRIFGDGTLTDDQMEDIFNEEIETIAPINATISLVGSTFADISSELPTIVLVSGFPLPVVTGNVELKNFTATTVNTITAGTIPASGILPINAMFNTMGSLSNYTTIATLDNGLEVFAIFSAFNLQSPDFSLPDGIDFFFQHQRDPTFSILSFNFTRTSIPFDISCNLKSELFANGTTFTFNNVGFLQELFPVPPLKDVVVACIDPNSPLLNPDEPSFGGSNALLTFVSFGDTTGIGAFLNFTDNYGDFFGAPLPFLFIILAAALFTGRSAPTGIIIVGIAIGAMWFMEILTIDPILWGIIVVLVILGAIGGKKFL